MGILYLYTIWVKAVKLSQVSKRSLKWANRIGLVLCLLWTSLKTKHQARWSHAMGVSYLKPELEFGSWACTLHIVTCRQWSVFALSGIFKLKVAIFITDPSIPGELNQLEHWSLYNCKPPHMHVFSIWHWNVIEIYWNMKFRFTSGKIR